MDVKVNELVKNRKIILIMRKIKLLKKVLTLFVLLLFIIIGFFHNSMMSFAMQN